MSRALPEALVDAWSAWFSALRQPVVVVLGSGWRRPERELLEAIRAELRALGAALVVVSESESFCFRPDVPEDALPVELASPEGLTALVNRYAVRSEGLDARVSITLLDERASARLQSTRVVTGELAEAVLETLRSARERADEDGRLRFSRREVVLASLMAAITLPLVAGCRTRESVPAPRPGVASRAPETNELAVTLEVNGKSHELVLGPRVSLLDALREHLGLTGTKKGCDHGQCGACAVLLDGRRVNSCLVLAVMARGKKIATIDGLADGDALHPLRAAFVKEDALQCGYCTPGELMSAAGLLRENQAHAPGELRAHMSGNLCRCGAYANIVRALESVQESGVAT
jgi:xanthine dehydrogenase YagT iron-sulfur-binding subunit